jgi:hypothetical protein
MPILNWHLLYSKSKDIPRHFVFRHLSFVLFLQSETVVTSRGSSVNAVTGIWTGRWGFDSWQEQGCFSSGVKRLEREAELPRLRVRGAVPPFPISFIGVALNYSRDSSVGIALGYVLDDRDSIPGGGVGNFSLHQRVQNGSGAHSASYPMGTRGSFPGGKAAGAWRWPLTSI